MAKKKTSYNKGECFVIMPISDPDGYKPGHFRHVYEDMFIPAIKKAGFTPKRADDETNTSLIHLGLIKDLVDCPMAICDLSNANPNVLFELGFRQAFDLPTVIVQESGTRRIFDIDGLRRHSYEGSLQYHEVMEFRDMLTEAILATEAAEQDDKVASMNSLVGLLGMAKATVKAGAELDAAEVMGILQDLSIKINRLENVPKVEPPQTELPLRTFAFELVHREIETAAQWNNFGVLTALKHDIRENKKGQGRLTKPEKSVLVNLIDRYVEEMSLHDA